MEIQNLFFEMAKSKLPPGHHLADIVCDILGITFNSAYRRIRGETELTVTEFITLCRHFNISVDSIINHKPDGVLFKYAPLDLRDMNNYYAHMDRLSDLFKTISQSAEKEVCFMVQDIPGVHFLPFLNLRLFKIYTWFRSVNQSRITYEEFVSQVDIPRLSAVFEKIENIYRQTPSTEIWTKDTVKPLLRQLEYYANLHCFERKETFSHLCRQFLELVENVEKYTLQEKKEYNGKTVAFRMYLSSVDIMNDFMITKGDGKNVTAIRLYAVNGVFTSNEYFCTEVETWMQDTIRKSLLLSGSSEMECFRFFQEMKDKITELQEKFEK
ncbi:MAG: hypothetical protein LBR65_04185 [Culturomica sp.]|jgi:hypothetical protein|nr:hypothetical protein [Culturomica sp.]